LEKLKDVRLKPVRKYISALSVWEKKIFTNNNPKLVNVKPAGTKKPLKLTRINGLTWHL
jgi:hypothetical protein